MSSRLWKFLVQDIIDAIARIQGYVHDLSLDEFQQDRKTLDAVERNFIIIGEASGQMPRQVRDKFPLVPWRDMSDMRNYVAHNYWGIEVQQVWDTIHLDLPGLVPMLKKRCLIMKRNKMFNNGCFTQGIAYQDRFGAAIHQSRYQAYCGTAVNEGIVRSSFRGH